MPSVHSHDPDYKLGFHNGKRLSAGSPFEAVGKFTSGDIDLETLEAVECKSCPGSGTCRYVLHLPLCRCVLCAGHSCSSRSRRRSPHFFFLTFLVTFARTWVYSGMFTANTMSTCIEALGMALPGSSTRPAIVPKTNE